MKFSMVVYREPTRPHFYFQVVLTIFREIVNICNYILETAESGLEYSQGVSLHRQHPSDNSVIIYADIESSAMSIGKTAYLFQILGTP